ncbi:MAG: exosome complex protein Rrp42 [Candidatus Micrarchaeota archaeon]
MGEEVRDVIMQHIRRDIMGSTLERGVRFDGRPFDEYRPISIQKGPIKTAEGSAIAKIGETRVLAAVKFDVLKPFADRPTEGVMITNAELLPLASPTFEPGPPDENSIEMARVVDRALRSAECVDLNTFFIETDKVLGLYVDLYVLNHAGNYTDAACLAATAALTDTKMPKIEEAKIVRGEYSGMLNPSKLPLTTTSVKVGEKWLVDPDRDEERVLETALTIGTTEQHVCAMQKGKGSLSREELYERMEIAFKRGDDIRRLLRD